MSRTPFISVVISTCDREALVLGCLESVWSQSYPDFEVLVIDQNPKRTLESAIQRKAPRTSRTRYFYVARAGLSAARNFGVERAGGEIVAFLDDDALAEPAWLNGVAEAFSLNPRPAWVGGRIDAIWVKQRPAWYPREREFLLGLYNIGDELKPMPEHDRPIGANMAGLRNVILHLGGFDERFGAHYFRRRPMICGEDTLLGERMKQAGYAIYYQPKMAVRHRIGPTKLTRAYFLRRHFWEGVTTLERLAVMGEVREKAGYFRYHLPELAMALARFVLPGFQNRYHLPKPEIRMLALSRAAFSLGVLYDLITLQADAESDKKSCASV